MGFDFPLGDKVVPLAFQQVSDEYPFSAQVPIEIAETYMRVIALWQDNKALGGNAPTIEIRSGEGGLTPLKVTTLAEAVNAVPIVGTDGEIAAQATCVRENKDVYLVHVFDIAETNGPWQLRLTNNDPQTLSFVAISSTDPDQTLQPWMVWGATPGSFTSAGDPKELGISLPGLFETHAVTVRNLGTAPLVFAERAGQSIGGPDSPVVIATLPTRTDRNGSPMIDTQGVGQVVFGVHHDGADADTAVTYTIHTNDSRHQAHLTLQVKRTNYPPPPPGAPCNIDHCPGYVPPPPYPPALGAPSSGPCAQAGCGHDTGFHGLGPACRLNDGCPGYRGADGGNSYPGHLRADGENCVQPECGHEWFRYHDPDFWSGSYCTYMDGCEEFLVGLGTDNCQRPGCQHSLAAHADPDRDLPDPGWRRGHPTLPGGHPGPIDPP